MDRSNLSQKMTRIFPVKKKYFCASLEVSVAWPLLGGWVGGGGGAFLSLKFFRCQKMSFQNIFFSNVFNYQGERF